MHPVLCKDFPKHPLIRERGRFYLERKEELALENMVRQLAEDKIDEFIGDPSEPKNSVDL